jgi:hypothetical protein
MTGKVAFATRKNPISLLKSLLVLLPLFLSLPALNLFAAEEYTRAECATDFVEYFHVTPQSDTPSTLYGMWTLFPIGFAAWTGNVYDADKPATLEFLLVSLVRYAGWDVLHYSKESAKTVEPYVSPEGLPYYQPDPTPRSIPFVAVALEKGLIDRAALPRVRENISKADMNFYLGKFDSLTAQNKPMSSEALKAFSLAEPAGGKTTAASGQDSGQLLVIDRGAPLGPFSSEVPNPVLDLRAPNIRLYKGPTAFNTGAQDYFPLGALDTVLTSSLAIPADSYIHQGQGIHGTVENGSRTANGIGLWGTAAAQAKGARVWAGFLDATTPKGNDQDAQIVGLEVDASNYQKPGVSPNASKVGIQVVGLGSAPVTNGIEIIGTRQSGWINGIVFGDHAVNEDGTAMGISQATPVKLGIDFSSTPFTYAAMRISNNSLLSFVSKNGGDSSIYADDINDGSLVFRAGRSGLRITNNQNSENLLTLSPDGELIVKGRVVSQESAGGAAGAGRASQWMVILTVVNAAFAGLSSFLYLRMRKKV